MSIILRQRPQPYSPSQNAQCFSFCASTWSEAGFEYLVDIRSADDSTLLARREVPRWPGVGWSVVDCSRIVSDYVDAAKDMVAPSSAPIPAPSTFKEYRVDLSYKLDRWEYFDYLFFDGRVLLSSQTQPHAFSIGDRIIVSPDVGNIFPNMAGRQIVIDTPSDHAIVIDQPFASGPVVGGTVAMADGSSMEFPLITSSTAVVSYIGAYNIDGPDRIGQYASLDYIWGMPPHFPKRLCSNVPDGFHIDKQGYFYLYSPSFSAQTTGIVFQQHDKWDNVVGWYRCQWTGTTGPAWFPAGPASLANINPFYVTTLSGPSTIGWNNVAYYDWYLVDAALNQTTEQRRFNLAPCTRYTPFTLLFLDRKGSYGSFTLRLKHEHNLSVSKSNYQHQPGRLFSTGFFTTSPGDRGTTTFHVEASDEYLLRTELQSAADATYFEDLLTSSNVLWVRDGAFTPVVIKDASYDIPTAHDKVRQMNVRISLANQRNTL